EAGAAVFAVRAPVGLLERLEDDLLLVERYADARVRDRDRDGRAGAVERLAPFSPPFRDPVRLERHPTSLGEFERIGEEVLQYLLQALRVGAQPAGEVWREEELEIEPLRLGDVPERALDVVLQILEVNLADVDDDRARFDLGQVEDVVD